MNNLRSLVLPAFLGLTAGVAHGIMSHQVGLPMSLAEQLVKPFVATEKVSYSFKN
ncbi:hypothetical protein N836_25200 [Leptolyngbya sp. Heron Island J]|uniref:hypothetical protein n=1 Tax=Leptolyngbya sp. Heron Island J TaxID=1385935 RepID=UPI0003B98EA3|nr:hypothetical protein [Leptolyngbya sp. Heron Island J]ESA32615.1 hypothetical protein N836_25200 [Leptolyngbya sp. Heron Island J]